MRDLEIRGAGSLVGAEQSGQLSAVGFDLFASMLSQALADEEDERESNKTSGGGSGSATTATARAAAEDVAYPDIRIEIPVPAFLPDEYLPPLGLRVLWYRRIAAARSREQLAALETKLRDEHGALPEPAESLIALAKVRIDCAEIGANAATVAGDQIRLKILKMPPSLPARLPSIGASYDKRMHVVTSRIPYGKNVATAVTTLTGAIVFEIGQD
jgi:transcription-repair coupling factor (superfamily II helicase)